MNFNLIRFFTVVLVLSDLTSFGQADKLDYDSTVSMHVNTYPYLKNDVEYEMQSSYDRSGGNDDGFSGKYSVIRKESNGAVISEISGAGTITRIWFPSEPDYPEEPLGLKNKRIYIYLDGNSKPVIDMPVVKMFNNSDPHFPYPLCGMGLGGCWSYVPISFNKGAKIVVEGGSAKFFQVQYNKYTGKGKLKTFVLENSPAQNGYKDLSDAMWAPGNIRKLVKQDAIFKSSSYNFHPGSNELPLIKGPAVMRGIMVKGSPEDLETFLKGNLSITWDDAGLPAVNVPLSMFFIREKNGITARSLLAGTLHGGEGVYNFFPMPFHDSAHAEMRMEGNCHVEITTIFENDHSDRQMAYLHINHVKDYPTTPGKKHVFLDVSGEGHYAGTYLRVAGKSLQDSATYRTLNWTGCLEGDEEFEADGKWVEHGTGTEDYFDAGWNGLQLRLDRPGIYPFHGFTVFDPSRDTSFAAAYRWRMPGEVIPFKKHFRATIEVGPADRDTGNYESISFYYLKDAGGAPTPQWRPAYHFTPQKNWTNDPNGLIYVDGTYHLFHQYNPFENKWGHMSWGHAKSKDLVHWTYMPVAMHEILGKDTVSIFSGSAVWDKNNSSGFCKTGGCLVAVFTGNYSLRKEAQYISYSNDTGRTFTYYDKNPVIDLNKKDFRDPNVFWYEPTKRWIMTVVLPAESKFLFYGSKDLKSWEKLSEFGPAGLAGLGYECPFLAPLPVDGNSNNMKWLLAVSSGGKGAFMQYFIGHFDGDKFTNDNPKDSFNVFDYGDAIYAGIPWNGTPGKGKTFIGWLVPGSVETYPWKGQMSIARDLSLRTTPQGIKLFQSPAALITQSLDALSQHRSAEIKNMTMANNEVVVDTKGIAENNSYWITADLVPASSKTAGFKLARQKKGNDKNREETIISFDAQTNILTVNRSGYIHQDIRQDKIIQQFSVAPINGKLALQILLDRSSLELFANNGEKALSTLIYPSENATGLSAFSTGGNARIENFKIWDLSVVR